MDVLNKAKAKILTPHYPYNLEINLEENTQSLVSTIYSLSFTG